MKDIEVVVEAIRQLNLTWTECSKNMENEESGTDFYNAMCEIDEAIINLVEKVGLCVKAKSVGIMYGDSTLIASHDCIVKRHGQ